VLLSVCLAGGTLPLVLLDGTVLTQIAYETMKCDIVIGVNSLKVKVMYYEWVCVEGDV
jgi:hypothetical protein